MKKQILCILISILSIIMLKNVYGNEKSIITVNEIIKLDDGYYAAPVIIQNNPGLMGFKISISYGDGVEIYSVSKGELTKMGQFSSNYISKKEEQSFDVLWNNTSEVKKDGSLCIIGFLINDDYKGRIIFSISYSVEDTFDESYNEINLSCKDVVIREEKNNNTDDSEENIIESQTAPKEKADSNTNIEQNVKNVEEQILNETVKPNVNTDSDDDMVKHVLVDSEVDKYLKDKVKYKKIVLEILDEEKKDNIEECDKEVFVEKVLHKIDIDSLEFTGEKKDDIYKRLLNAYNDIIKNNSDLDDYSFDKSKKPYSIVIFCFTTGIFLIILGFIVINKMGVGKKCKGG